MSSSSSNFLPSPEGIHQLVAWVREAGQIALRSFNNVEPYPKADRTWLTEADLEIEQFLAERLKTAYPNCRLIGEEGTQDQLDSTDPHIWVIDPIDGTTAFSQGLPGWGISLGLLHQGLPRFGLFYMPLLDQVTYSTASDEIYRNQTRLNQSVRRQWREKDFLAINASAHAEFQIEIRHTRALGSISTNLIYTAWGTAAAALITRAYLWDLVAGSAILTGAGGTLTYLSGTPIDYLSLLDGRLATEPIIAAHPDIQTILRKRIHPFRQ